MKKIFSILMMFTLVSTLQLEKCFAVRPFNHRRPEVNFSEFETDSDLVIIGNSEISDLSEEEASEEESEDEDMDEDTDEAESADETEDTDEAVSTGKDGEVHSDPQVLEEHESTSESDSSVSSDSDQNQIPNSDESSTEETEIHTILSANKLLKDEVYPNEESDSEWQVYRRRAKKHSKKRQSKTDTTPVDDSVSDDKCYFQQLEHFKGTKRCKGKLSRYDAKLQKKERKAFNDSLYHFDPFTDQMDFI